MRYKIGDKVVYKDIEKIQSDSNDKAREAGFVKRPIVNGETVYFDRKCDSPRKAFKHDYPDCKIVYDPYKADVIVAGDNFKDSWSYRSPWQQVFVRLDPNYRGWNRNYLEDVTLPTAKAVIDINHVVERWEMFDSGKPFINDKMIKASATYGRVMESNEVESIGKLIASRDVEMANLGLTMLQAFDYENNQDSFALVFLQMRRTDLLSSRVLKALKRKLKEKYVNLRI